MATKNTKPQVKQQINYFKMTDLKCTSTAVVKSANGFTASFHRNALVLTELLAIIKFISPNEVDSVYIEHCSFGSFLAIKQLKSSVVFKGTGDFSLHGNITSNTDTYNADVRVELISSRTILGSGPVCFSVGDFNVYVLNSDSGFIITVVEK